MENTAAPVPKVVAATAAAAVTTIGVWLIEQFSGVEVPTIVQGAFTTLMTFGAGYAAPRQGS